MSTEPHHSSRRWSRILDLLPTRRRRSPPAPPPHLPTDSTRSRRARRNRNRRHSPERTTQYHSAPVLPISALHARSLPIRSSDDTSDDSNTPSPTITDVNGRPHVVSNALAELDAMQDHDLFAVFNRLFDDYNSTNSSDYEPPALYLGRLPPNPSRHRVAIRIPNAYYNPNRRQGRHSQLTTELERELRLNMRSALRAHAGASTGSTYDASASDAQIEALPTFTMEKDETRSVQQIFATMKHHTVGHVEQRVDECGGLMTSYTECAICLSDFEPGDEITALPCGHFFHLTGCVREWLRNHARTCPTCRADIGVPSNTASGFASHAGGISTGDGGA